MELDRCSERREAGRAGLVRNPMGGVVLAPLQVRVRAQNSEIMILLNQQ